MSSTLAQPTCARYLESTDVPQQPTRVSRLELAAIPSAAPLARLHAADILCRWRLEQVVDDAKLLVSELVTNAIRHSGTSNTSGQDLGRCASCDRPLASSSDYPRHDDTERIRLTLAHVGNSLFVDVFDHDPRPPVARQADPWSEGGRGLLLFTRLSRRWNYFHPESGGKVVWCELALS